MLVIGSQAYKMKLQSTPMANKSELNLPLPLPSQGILALSALETGGLASVPGLIGLSSKTQASKTSSEATGCPPPHSPYRHQ